MVLLCPLQTHGQTSCHPPAPPCSLGTRSFPLPAPSPSAGSPEIPKQSFTEIEEPCMNIA